MILLVLPIWLIGCASQPRGNWSEPLQFKGRPDIQKWEISKAGLDQFYADCKFQPGPSDDPVTDAGDGKVLITPAFYTSLLKACEKNRKP